MAAAMMDCTGWERALEQKMQCTAIKDEQNVARETSVLHLSEQEDEHGIVWIPAAPASFRADGTFFCVRVEGCDVSALKLNKCFFQEVFLRECEIDGLTLNNCKFDNVRFEGCSFHDVTLHHICLHDVVYRGVTFTNYTWTNEKIVGREFGADPARPIITGCRLGDSILADTSDPDWIVQTQAAAVALAESDEAFARRLRQEEYDSENQNPWKDWSNNSMNQSESRSIDRNAKTRNMLENDDIEREQCSEAKVDEENVWVNQGGKYNTAPATTQLRDITDQQNGSGRVPTESKGSHATKHRLVEYSDSEDDALDSPKPESAPSQKKAVKVLADEPAPRTHHMFDEDAVSVSSPLVNTSSQQNGIWVSEKKSSLAPYDPKSWKSERRKDCFPKHIPAAWITLARPSAPVASIASSVAPSDTATSSTSASGSDSTGSNSTNSSHSIATSNATTNINHSIRSTLTEKELEFLPKNQIGVTDGARCTDPPHVRARRERRVATETRAAGANAAQTNAPRSNAPRAKADMANAARSGTAGSNAAGLTRTSSQLSQSNSSAATSGRGVAGGPGAGPSRTQTEPTTAATTATGAPRTSTEGTQKIFVHRPKDFYSR